MLKGRIPSFYSGECEPIEFIHAAILLRDWKRFDPKIHRNQGWKGSGFCDKIDCEVCRVMRLHGV